MLLIGVRRLRGSKGKVRQTKRGQSVSKGAIAGKENKKEGQTSGSSTRKVRKKRTVWPKTIQNEGNDVTEVLCVFSDSDVSLCFPVSEFPAPDCLLVWPREIENDECDNDVIEVVSVLSDSDVVPCFSSLDSLAPVDLLTDSGCMCVSAWSAAVCFAI